MHTPKLKRPIVLEGPDGSGKTTLGLILSNHFGLPYLHTGGPLKSWKEFDERMDWARRQGVVIFDRISPISGLVYAIFQPTGETFVPGWGSFRQLNPHVVMCTRHPDLNNPDIRGIFLKEQEHKVTHKSAEYTKQAVDRAEEVQSRYRLITTILENRGMKPILYDWGVNSPAWVIDKITLEEGSS